MIYRMKVLLTVLLLSSLSAQQTPDAETLIDQYKAAEDTVVKFNLLVQMGQTRDDRVSAFLRKEFPKEKQPTLRRQMLWTLAQLGTRRAAETLAEFAYAFEEPEITSAACAIIDLLRRKGLLWPFAERLAKQKSTRYATAQSALAESLPTEGGDLPKSLKILKSLIRSKSHEVRRAALMTLGDIDNPDAVRIIGSCVKDPVCGVARLAVMILGDRRTSDVMDYLLDALQSKHAEVVVAAIEAAKWGSSGKLLGRLCRLVAHRDERVRQAAREALLAQQLPQSIDMLIENMRRHAALRSHYAEALKFLTGQDFGDDPLKWKAWWEKNRDTFRMRPPPQRARATFFGTAVTSNRVVFVIDVSGSMSQKYRLKKPLPMRTTPEGEKAGKALEVIKIEMAKRELINAITRLPFDAKFNIVFYNQNYHAWRKALQRATYRNKQAAIEFVKNFKPRGRTNIYDSLMFALKDREVDTIYLLSDGMPNTGTVTEPKQIIEKVTAENRGRVVINTFGFGLRRKGREFMRELARRNRGRFVDM